MPMRRVRHLARTGGARWLTLYLVAVMDWFSRRVLAKGLRHAIRPGLLRRLSNTMDADFCIEALHEAMARFGRPAIFNTDQGSQFTSPRFTEVLAEGGVRISMDGRGRWLDNVFIERLWRSLKYECIYLNAFETGSEARAGIGRWITYYNGSRPHTALGGRAPAEVHTTAAGLQLAA
jgi:putative transposase